MSSIKGYKITSIRKNLDNQFSITVKKGKEFYVTNIAKL